MTTSPGTIIAAITYTTQLLNGVLMLVMLFQNISRGYVSWKRVTEILDMSPDLVDGVAVLPTHPKGEIRFEHVHFAYPGSQREVLTDINLHIPAGKTIALMGATGSGKSTLANLISRFYEVNQGKVCVDGIDVRDYSKLDLRQCVTYVLQKSELFSLTIQENIAWDKPQASLKEIQEASCIAQADEFIQTLPKGYETKVAEGGNSLSGGQKQRIAIARALLRGSQVLIFDDATSALDLKTEAQFYQALKHYSPDSTKIIIAQRIATVLHADEIYILDKGHIIDHDTHDQLLSRCAIYQYIYASQMGEEEAYA